MGTILKLLSLVRSTRNGITVSDITADPGGGANVTAELFQPAGEDSQSLQGDYLIGVSISTAGGKAIVGFIDPANAPKSEPGDVRRYSRNGAGAQVAEIWLKNDGSVTINNANGWFDLTAAGVIELNGDVDNAVRFSALESGFNTLRTELNALITAYNSAVYTIGGVGTTGTTSTPGVPAAAEISGAKVDEVTLP